MTSPMCFLSGHAFKPTEGTGLFAGRTFSICAQCGAFEFVTDRAEHHQEAAAAMDRQMQGRRKDGVRR